MDEMLMEDEQLMFDSTAIEKVINESLDNILAENMFDESKSQMWINKVAESILSGLQTMNKPFKFCFLFHYNFAIAVFPIKHCNVILLF